MLNPQNDLVTFDPCVEQLYCIVGNFRLVKFSFQVLKTSFRGLIFVLGRKCSIEKYTGPRRETQRTHRGLKYLSIALVGNSALHWS